MHKISLKIPPKTPVITAAEIAMIKPWFCSIAICAPSMLKTTSPMASSVKN